MGSEFPFVLMLLPIVAVVYYLVWRQSARNVALRRLALAEKSAVQRLSERSSHKIVGRVRYAEPPLEAPFSARLCACYDARVEENGYVAAREGKAIDFCVEDETGSVLIRSDGLRLLAKKSPPGGLDRSKIGPRLEAFLKRHGRSTRFLWLRRMRWREEVVEEGQRVAVFGTAFLELDRDALRRPGAYRDHAKRIVIRRTAKTPLIVSNEEITFD